jgi:hypothetical protein
VAVIHRNLMLGLDGEVDYDPPDKAETT